MPVEDFDAAVEKARRYLVDSHESMKAWSADNTTPEDADACPPRSLVCRAGSRPAPCPHMRPVQAHRHGRLLSPPTALAQSTTYSRSVTTVDRTLRAARKYPHRYGQTWL